MPVPEASCRMTPSAPASGTPGSPGALRRIGAIGDVHCEERLLQRALDLLAAEGADLVVCTGDIVDGQGDVAACCALLQGESVVTVRGNHDRWFLRACTDDAFLEGFVKRLPNATSPHAVPPVVRALLQTLRPTVELSTIAGPLLLCHGLGSNDMARLKPDDSGYALEANTELQQLLAEARYPLVIGGHTHVPMVRRLGALTVINPGTLKRDESPGVALVDLAAQQVTFFSLERPAPEVSARLGLVP